MGTLEDNIRKHQLEQKMNASAGTGQMSNFEKAFDEYVSDSIEKADRLNHKYLRKEGDKYIYKEDKQTRKKQDLDTLRAKARISNPELFVDKNKVVQKYSKDVDYNSVREWSGDDITDKDINDVLDTLTEEADISFSEMKVSRGQSREMFYDQLYKKLDELYSEVREGMWPAKMSKKNVTDILWGVLMAKSN